MLYLETQQEHSTLVAMGFIITSNDQNRQYLTRPQHPTTARRYRPLFKTEDFPSLIQLTHAYAYDQALLNWSVDGVLDAPISWTRTHLIRLSTKLTQ